MEAGVAGEVKALKLDITQVSVEAKLKKDQRKVLFDDMYLPCLKLTVSFPEWLLFIASLSQNNNQPHQLH